MAYFRRVAYAFDLLCTTTSEGSATERENRDKKAATPPHRACGVGEASLLTEQA